MSVTDKQILGSNLCNIECTEKNNIIHPETCVNQVLIGNGSTVNLPAWFDGDADPEVHHGSFGDYSNMLAWLEANYPHNTYTLPKATNEVLGGIKVGEHLTIDSETGVLSVNLNIPSYSQATYTDLGLIKLGNNNPLPSTVGSDITIFPVQLDSVGHAGVAIPNSNLTQVNSDWTAESGSPAYIEHKPSISNAQITLQLNSAVIDSFTLNQNTPSTINISLGQPLNSIQTLGTPVAANKTFVWNGSEWTYGNVNEYELQPATDQALGGIKIGYTDNGALRAVQLETGTNRAYVDVADENLKNHEVVSIAKAISDQYGDTFYLYNVKCNLSDEILKIVNKKDFTQTDSSYAHSLTLNGNIQWSKSINDVNKAVGLLYIAKTACKGLLKITITQNTGSMNERITSDYFLGFVADTPPDSIFGIFTNLDWQLVLRSKMVGQTGYLYCYLKVPDEFDGTITVTGMGGAQHLTGSTPDPQIHSFYYDGNTTTTYTLLDTEGTLESAMCCTINSDDDYAGDPYDSSDTIGLPDAFVCQDTLSIGTVLYDNEVNDAVIHSLVSRVKRLETLVYNIINQNNNF